MTQLITKNEDLLLTASMELQRMFDMLSNSHGGPRLPENARILSIIETRLTNCLEDIHQAELDRDSRR